jgi:hypothetical protein
LLGQLSLRHPPSAWVSSFYLVPKKSHPSQTALALSISGEWPATRKEVNAVGNRQRPSRKHQKKKRKTKRRDRASRSGKGNLKRKNNMLLNYQRCQIKRRKKKTENGGVISSLEKKKRNK